MANFELKFNCNSGDGTTIQCIESNNIIQIKMDDDDGCCIIDLDKSTAIKFAKTLRTEINKIRESEVNNG